MTKPIGIMCRPENYETAVKLLQDAGLLGVPVELKPCPFCGESFTERHVNRLDGKHFIKCHNWNCGISTPAFEMPEDADKCWNRRKLDEPSND